jgi:serine/threonine protein kinase
MALAPGTRLGTYVIEAALPEGGRELYAGRDTRLDRPVSIEVVPGSAVTASDFDRETRVLSRLRHPRIVSLFDAGEAGGVRYLVREWVEGETLAARLPERPLPLAEALAIAVALADALEAGHRQGVTHGSVSSADVVLTRGGTKLQGYGRLRLMGIGARDGANARSDIAALGTIVSEMLAAGRASADVDGPLEPTRLEVALARCFAMDPAAGWTSAGALAAELRVVIEEARSANSSARGAGSGSSSSRTRRQWLVVALMGAALAAAVLAIVALR